MNQEKMAVQFNRAVYKMILLVSFFAIIQHTADADAKQVKIIFNPDFIQNESMLVLDWRYKLTPFQSFICNFHCVFQKLYCQQIYAFQCIFIPGSVETYFASVMSHIFEQKH